MSHALAVGTCAYHCRMTSHRAIGWTLGVIALVTGWGCADRPAGAAAHAPAVSTGILELTSPSPLIVPGAARDASGFPVATRELAAELGGAEFLATLTGDASSPVRRTEWFARTADADRNRALGEAVRFEPITDTRLIRVRASTQTSRDDARTVAQAVGDAAVARVRESDAERRAGRLVELVRARQEAKAGLDAVLPELRAHLGLLRPPPDPAVKAAEVAALEKQLADAKRDAGRAAAAFREIKSALAEGRDPPGAKQVAVQLVPAIAGAGRQEGAAAHAKARLVILENAQQADESASEKVRILTGKLTAARAELAGLIAGRDARARLEADVARRREDIDRIGRAVEELGGAQPDRLKWFERPESVRVALRSRVPFRSRAEVGTLRSTASARSPSGSLESHPTGRGY